MSYFLGIACITALPPVLKLNIVASARKLLHYLIECEDVCYIAGELTS